MVIEPSADSLQRADFLTQLGWDRVVGAVEAAWLMALGALVMLAASSSCLRPEKEMLPMLLLDRLPPSNARPARTSTSAADQQGHLLHGACVVATSSCFGAAKQVNRSKGRRLKSSFLPVVSASPAIEAGCRPL